MTKTTIPTLIAVLLLLASCTPTEKYSDSDLKSTVDEIGNNAEKCFLAGDVDAMLQYYSDDIVSMPNLCPMIRGKADLKRQTEAVISSGMKFQSLQSTTLEVHDSGDLVYEIGTFSQSILMPGQSNPIPSTGKYLNIYKRQPDGQLKIAVEIYNSNDMPQ